MFTGVSCDDRCAICTRILDSNMLIAATLMPQRQAVGSRFAPVPPLLSLGKGKAFCIFLLEYPGVGSRGSENYVRGAVQNPLRGMGGVDHVP